MLKIRLRRTPDKLVTEENFYELAQCTEGASGSDIDNLVRHAFCENRKRCKPFQQYYKNDKYWMPRLESGPHCASCPDKSSDATCPNTKCQSKWMKLEDVPPGTLKPPPLCMNDFRNALKSWRRTVPSSLIEQFELFHSQNLLAKNFMDKRRK